MGIFSGSTQTIGHKYYLGMHLILCYGPVEELFRMRVGERGIYESANAGGPDDNITANGTFIVKGKDTIFGGEKREGGVGATAGAGSAKAGVGSGLFARAAGTLVSGSAANSGGDFDVAFGGVSQVVNPYIDSVITGEVPAYRGVMGIIFKGFYFGNSPYIKDFAFEIARYPDVIPGAGAESKIGDDSNPAHMMWEVLTNVDWGMGYTNSDMHLASFQAVSTTLFNEGFGMSLVWGDSQPIQDFIELILTHINGTLYLNPSTGQFTIKLIRDDFVIASLPVFNESNIVEMNEFSRAAWGETTNEITVIYKNRETAKDIPVTVQDMANIQLQGTTISTTRQYPGITKEQLAIKIALRDLQTISSPFAKIKMKVDRNAWDLVVGDAFVLEWPKFGITQVVFRVGGVNYGSLKDGHITVDAIEDAFALPAAEYAAPQESGWVEPRQDPEAVVDQFVREMTYWEVVQSAGASGAENANPNDNAYYLTCAKPNTAQYTFVARSKPNGINALFLDDGLGAFAPTGLIDAEMLPAVDSTFTYTNGLELYNVQVGSLIEMNGEIMQLYSLDPDILEIKVWRGMLDTVPITHAINSRFFANGNFAATSILDYTLGDAVDIKAITTAGGGELAEASAPTIVYTFTGRFGRPLVAGNVRVEGLAAWTTRGMTLGDANLLWSHRNRTLQIALQPLIYQDDVSLTFPVGHFYTLRLFDDKDVLVRTETPLVVDNYTWVDETADQSAPAAGQLLNSFFRFELEVDDAGNLSHTIIDYTFERADYGFGYGNYYGGFP